MQSRGEGARILLDGLPLLRPRCRHVQVRRRSCQQNSSSLAAFPVTSIAGICCGPQGAPPIACHAFDLPVHVTCVFTISNPHLMSVAPTVLPHVRPTFHHLYAMPCPHPPPHPTPPFMSPCQWPLLLSCPHRCRPSPSPSPSPPTTASHPHSECTGGHPDPSGGGAFAASAAASPEGWPGNSRSVWRHGIVLLLLLVLTIIILDFTPLPSSIMVRLLSRGTCAAHGRGAICPPPAGHAGEIPAEAILRMHAISRQEGG